MSELERVLTDDWNDFVVAVVFQGEWRWYRTIPEYWFLDLPKWMADFGDAQASDIADFRFGVRILDESTAGQFLSAIEHRRQTLESLRLMLKEYLPFLINDEEDEGGRLMIRETYPQFLVDFDRREFTSHFTPDNQVDVMFENYVPEGWKGQFAAFIEKVPEEQRYWVIDGEDVYEARLKYDPIRDWSRGW